MKTQTDMKRKYIIVPALAAGILAACTEEQPNGGGLLDEPAIVQTLVAPQEGAEISLDNIETLAFEWSAAEWTGYGDVEYDLVFDYAEGDFSEPVYILPAEQSGVTKIFIPKSMLDELFYAGITDNKERISVSWAVIARSGSGLYSELSSEIRDLILTKTPDPAIVTDLLAPANGYDVVMKNLQESETVDFSWEAPVWLGEGDLSYEVVIDRPDGDFSAPLFKSPRVSETSVAVSREDFEAILETLASDEYSVSLKWAVNSFAGDNAWTSSVSSALNVVQQAKPFETGDPLYIGGAGSETGQQTVYIPSDYFNVSLADFEDKDCSNKKVVDYNYEIFTKLQAGTPFYFYAGYEDYFYTVSADGSTFKEISDASEAEGTVPSDGIYRIRFSTETGKTKVQIVTRVYCRNTSNATNIMMDYQGNGLWEVNNASAPFSAGNTYKFMVTAGGEGDGFDQPYGVTYQGTLSQDADESLWYVQPVKKGGNVLVYTYPSGLGSGLHVRLYLNNDKGHYTHEFLNWQ